MSKTCVSPGSAARAVNSTTDGSRRSVQRIRASGTGIAGSSAKAQSPGGCGIDARVAPAGAVRRRATQPFPHQTTAIGPDKSTIVFGIAPVRGRGRRWHQSPSGVKRDAGKPLMQRPVASFARAGAVRRRVRASQNMRSFLLRARSNQTQIRSFGSHRRCGIDVCDNSRQHQFRAKLAKVSSIVLYLHEYSGTLAIGPAAGGLSTHR